MNKIIVPVDFSEISENALKTGAHFAKKYDAELLVLHMLEISNVVVNKSGSYMQEEALFYLKLAERRFDEFLDKEYLKGVKSVIPIVKHFKVFSEINEVASTEKADLIIMGSHGATGLKEFFVGSNTEKVVRNSDIPVLVIKDKPILTNFDTGFFATDFSDEEVDAYLRAKKMFKKFGTKMNLLHVNTPTRSFKSTGEIEKSAVDFLTKAEGNIESLSSVKYTADYTVEQGVLNYANVSGADIISMATHGRKGLNHLFEGSISEDVANTSALPVITFKL